jgi:hypothetical protein
MAQCSRITDPNHMRLSVDRLGTALVVILTLVVLALFSAQGALRFAVDDLHAQAAIARSDEPRPTRSPIGERLSGLFTSDLSPEDMSGLDARGLELDHRADRLLELTAVVALAGMLVALFTGRPALDVATARDASRPLASTSSNGTV